MKNHKLVVIVVLICSLLTACSAKQADAPSGMKRLSNDFADYNMFVPEAWVIVSDESTGYSSAYYNERDRSNITVTAFKIDAVYSSLDEFWAVYEEEFASTFSDMEYVSDERVTLDGYEAKAVEYTATITNIKYKYMQLVCVRGDIVYLITYTATEDNYDDHIETVWAVLGEFSFK